MENPPTVNSIFAFPAARSCIHSGFRNLARKQDATVEKEQSSFDWGQEKHLGRNQKLVQNMQPSRLIFVSLDLPTIKILATIFQRTLESLRRDPN